MCFILPNRLRRRQRSRVPWEISVLVVEKNTYVSVRNGKNPAPPTLYLGCRILYNETGSNNTSLGWELRPRSLSSLRLGK